MAQTEMPAQAPPGFGRRKRLHEKVGAQRQQDPKVIRGLHLNPLAGETQDILRRHVLGAVTVVVTVI